MRIGTLEDHSRSIRFVLSRIGFVFFLVWHLILFLMKNSVVVKILALLVLVAGIFFYVLFQPLPDNFVVKDQTAIEIPGGANFRQVADTLVSAGLLKHRDLFLVLGKLSGKEKNMQAGRFTIPGGLSTWQLLNYMETAAVSRYKATLPEGILSYKMGAILEKSIGIDSAKFVSLVHDSAFVDKFLPDAASLEGYLMPETYQFEWKTPEEQIIRHLASNTLSIFEPDSVQQRMLQMGMTSLEIITLASIIEGEVVVDSERVVVSSLYHNRLRLGWPLQADPTVQYAIPGPPRRLLHRDLEIDSPYNTYKYAGLPPGPINNPGKNSIYAALYPAETPYLYMVAIGDGRHKFSKTLREHNRWHTKFNEVRRRVRREQRAKQNSQN